MNNSSAMKRIKCIHFVGIGGTGMAGIAEVLLTEGCTVTGSDVNENAVVKYLRDLGAQIFIGHKLENVANADVIVISTAIQDDNPEIIAAKEKRIPIVRRAEMLAELMRFREGIAIAGTHGKTTTTSLAASLLAEGGLDPTFVIGGLLNSVGSNARLGSGKYLVAEADESDASFLFLKPLYTVITNIDADHLGTYQGEFAQLEHTFLRFLHHLPFYGLAVMCLDDPGVRGVLADVSRPVITYGFAKDADVRVSNFKQTGLQSEFTLQQSGYDELQACLNLPGEHNVLNATAALIIARECGVSDDAILKALREFQGIGRRFQVRGELSLPSKQKALLVDDYGHHPREISATLLAARNAWPERRIVLAFQPHRYTRTKDLYEDFTVALSETDMLILFDVYTAGEEKISGADGRSLARSIRQRGKVEPVFVADNDDFKQVLDNVIRDGDILIMQGAGNIGVMAQELATEFA